MHNNASISKIILLDATSQDITEYTVWLISFFLTKRNLLIPFNTVREQTSIRTKPGYSNYLGYASRRRERIPPWSKWRAGWYIL